MRQNAFERAAGLTKGQITKWKQGFKPNHASQEKLAAFMHMTLEELMRDDDAQARYDEDSNEPVPVSASVRRDNTGIYIRKASSSGTPGSEDASEESFISILPDSALSDGSCFAVIMEDDSMEPYIGKGNIIIANRNAEISSGDIVTVSTPGEPVVCRKIHYEKNGFTLQPFNRNSNAIYYSNSEIESLPVAITGKVISHIENF